MTPEEREAAARWLEAAAEALRNGQTHDATVSAFRGVALLVEHDAELRGWRVLLDDRWEAIFKRQPERPAGVG